jgi:D-amino-acid oxidase
LQQFQVIPESQLRPGIHHAYAVTSVCINPSIYLPWLASQCLKAGIVLKRANLTHISDAAALPDVHHDFGDANTDLIINCTGLSSLKLGGVEDTTMYPIRGQLVLVRNNPGGIITVGDSLEDGSDEKTYMMTRAAGGGTVLGGSTQKNNWDSQVDPSLALRIMKRCVEMCPALTGGKGIEHLDVIRHAVGLRPGREGGARVEREMLGETWVVHNYGHGGAGYQSSYGCAEAVVKLVSETL